MKIALAQINPTVGDFPGNWRRIQEAVGLARRRGAELCIFPEMATTGCPPRDLLFQDRFIRDNLALLDRLASHTTDIGVVIGYVRPSTAVEGTRLQNAAAVIDDGEIISTHAKTRLSSNDVFDEERYFGAVDAVTVVNFRGLRLAVTLSGDIFQPAMLGCHADPDGDPVSDAVSLGAEIIINISALPFALEHRGAREQLFADVARAHHRPVVFVNQVGGSDECVFDGNSFALSPSGRVIARARGFGEDLVIVDIESDAECAERSRPDEVDDVIDALSLGIRDFMQKNGYPTLAVGLSDSLESKVASVVAARAVGPENVLGFIMPNLTDDKTLEDLTTLAETLGIGYRVLPIDHLVQTFLDPSTEVAAERSRLARDAERVAECVRCMLLTNAAAAEGHLLVETHCRSDIDLGRPTHFCGDVALFRDVLKTQIHRIADRLRQKGAPSLDLSPGSGTDKGFLLNQEDPSSFTPYAVLDELLMSIDDHGMDAQTISSLGFDEALVHDIVRRLSSNELKRRTAPLGFRITSRSLSNHRHLPVSQRWRI
jgi:NAD+ synthase (glutamine-hydrolysing)